MTEQKPWYKKTGYVLILILVVVLVLVLYINNKNKTNSQAALQKQQSAEAQISQSAPYSEPTDSSAHDQQDESKVNFARLKSFIKKIQGQPVDTASLDSQINQIINANKDITFGVSINYLKTGQIHNYGSTQAMTAASVTKVLTAVDYYKQVELGHKSLDTIMPNGKTAKYNIEQMIVVSDNNAWHFLNEDLTYEQMQQYAHSIGLNSYSYADNTISASDETKLLTDTYQRQLINEANTEQLLSYMERANYRDLVIPAVPETDTIYHKAGEYSGYLHDATIITDADNTIVLTIFTRSTGSYSKSRVASLMQQITTPTLETFHLN